MTRPGPLRWLRAALVLAIAAAACPARAADETVQWDPSGVGYVVVPARDALTVDVGPYDQFVVLDPMVVAVLPGAGNELVIESLGRAGTSGVLVFGPEGVRTLGVDVRSVPRRAATVGGAPFSGTMDDDPDGLYLNGTAQALWGPPFGVLSTHQLRLREQIRETAVGVQLGAWANPTSGWRLTNLSATAANRVGSIALGDMGAAILPGVAARGSLPAVRGISGRWNASPVLTIDSRLGVARELRCCNVIDPTGGVLWSVDSRWTPSPDLRAEVGAGLVTEPAAEVTESFGRGRVVFGLGPGVGEVGASRVGPASTLVAGYSGRTRTLTFMGRTEYQTPDARLGNQERTQQAQWSNRVSLQRFFGRGLGLGAYAADAFLLPNGAVPGAGRTLAGGSIDSELGPLRLRAGYGHWWTRGLAPSFGGNANASAMLAPVPEVRISAFGGIGHEEGVSQRVITRAVAAYRPDRRFRAEASYRGMWSLIGDKDLHNAGVTVGWQGPRGSLNGGAFAVWRGDQSAGLRLNAGAFWRVTRTSGLGIQGAITPRFSGGGGLSPFLSASWNIAPEGFRAAGRIVGLRGAVEGTVFVDRNGNGVRDDGERPWPGAVVQLDGGRTVTADEEGRFELRGLMSGPHVLTVEPDAEARIDARPLTFSVQGGAATIADVPVLVRSRIAGRLFIDIDMDGAFSEGDLPTNGIPILLNDERGSPVDRVFTVDGYFSFTNVPPGSYTVSPDLLALPPGYEGGTPLTDRFRVPNGQHEAVFALQALRSAGGTVYVDTNGNRRRDPGDQPLSGALVRLSDGRSVFADDRGRYTFRKMPVGEFRITTDGALAPATVSFTTQPKQVRDADLLVALVDGAAPTQDTPYRDPETGRPVVDTATGRAVLIDPTTGLPALRDNETGAYTPWSPPVRVADVPYVDPRTGEAVVDADTGRPVLIDPATGLPALKDPRTGRFSPWEPPAVAVADTPYVDPETGRAVVDPVSGRPVLIDPATGLPALKDPRSGRFSPWEPPAIQVADTPWVDPSTGEPGVDPVSGRPVLIDPATGLPALKDPRTGRFSAWEPPEVAVADADVPYLDPETGRPAIDPASGRPVVVTPNTGIPALRDPRTGRLVPWAGPPDAVGPVLVPVLDGETGRPVIDPGTGRPVVLDPVSGLPSLRAPGTGELRPWSVATIAADTDTPYLDPATGEAVVDADSGRPVFTDPATGTPVIVTDGGAAQPWTPPGFDPVVDRAGVRIFDGATGLPVLRAEESGDLVLRDPSTGAINTWAPPVRVETQIGYIDPETGATVVDPVTGRLVVVDPATGGPAVRDPESGELVAWEPPADARDYEEYRDPSGQPVRDPVSGQVVLLNPRTGETIVIDPETRRARVVQVQVEARLLSVRLSPASVILKVDEFRQLSASANYSDRTSRDVSGAVTWTSSNPRIASVDRTGRITGRAAGFAEITATFDGTASEVLQVEVIQLPLVGLALDPAELSVEPGATAQINAQAIYTDGSVADFTESVRWSTSDPLVATVSRGGEVTGVAPGTASISGEFQGVSTFPATVRVGDLDVQGLVVDAQASSLAVGDTFRATVTAVLPGGATRDVSAQARWQVGDALILRERDGVVSAVGSGETTVVATWGRGRSEPVTVRVQSQAPLGIVLSPAVPILLEGATASLRATAVYTDGTAQALTEGAEWRSSDPNVLGVGPDGTLTARRAGRAQITALRGNLSSQPMEVLVASAQTSRFEVSSTREALAPGATAQIDAYVRLQDGVQFDITSLASWTSTDPSVATVDGGRVVAVAPGTARLNARWSGLVAPAVVVEVAAPTPLAVTIDPLVERTVVGATMRLSATGVFMDGSTAGVTDAATWTSGNTAVLEVVAPGQVRALRPGTAGVDVSLGGVSAGTLVVRVMESPVQSLALAPANVNTGGLRPLVLTATLADGSTLDLTHAATWTVTDPRVATVSEAGVAFGVSAGTTTVRGTFGTYTAEATLTVTR